MTVLETIIANKKHEISLKKTHTSSAHLERLPLFQRQCISLKTSLQQRKGGIIAEHKRRSPSKDVINQNLTLRHIVSSYDSGGAAAISVLTDATYFGGSLEDLWIARSITSLPLLRKEFVVDEYQIIEAKAFGADAILLIAAALSKVEIKKLSECSKNLGLEVLLEVHSREELEGLAVPSVDIIGVNNRDLKTLKVSIETSLNLNSAIPSEFVKISESGIENPLLVKDLQKSGYQGFLIGEYFMKTPHPGETLSEFINQMQ